MVEFREKERLKCLCGGSMGGDAHVILRPVTASSHSINRLFPTR